LKKALDGTMNNWNEIAENVKAGVGSIDSEISINHVAKCFK
jgi:hypothetical protein